MTVNSKSQLKFFGETREEIEEVLVKQENLLTSLFLFYLTPKVTGSLRFPRAAQCHACSILRIPYRVPPTRAIDPKSGVLRRIPLSIQSKSKFFVPRFYSLGLGIGT